MDNTQARRIVVGYDGSEPAGAALDWAATEAHRRGSHLVVLHVLDHSQALPGPLRSTPWPNLGDELQKQITAEAQAWARKHDAVLEFSSVVEHGQAAHTLIEATNDAELLVLGTRGHSNVTGALLGSVSTAVSAHAHCPVVVIRGDSILPPGPHRPVVVGVDDSPGADTALCFAARTAAEARARLIVVSAYQPDLVQRLTGIESKVFDTESGRGYIAQARSLAERAAADAASDAVKLHPELDISQLVQPGAAAAVVGAATYQVGLAVVGRRGRGGFAELILGSTSHRLLQIALCPVAVVPAPITSDHKGFSLLHRSTAATQR
jgi:nucleotide-binding universal stress UspA family protein